MIYQQIQVNNFPFHPSFGSPVSFQGNLSGKTLAGIDVEFHIEGSGHSSEVDALLDQEVVTVEDPFVNRSYRASIRQTSHSNFNDRAANYHFELREIDMTPEFKILEIEGHQYPVARFVERDLGEEGVDRDVLLHLSKEQFEEVQSLFKPGPILVRRIGVDEEPLTVRYGGGMYWSQHEEGDNTYYKQIVHLVPIDIPVSNKINLAIGTEQEALVRMVCSLTARFEALVNELAQNNVISLERKSAIIGDDWKGLLDTQRIEDITRQTMRVRDADEELIAGN
ncbi:MAG TPA: hypothetical protein VEL49_04690 [Ktedonobacteraceae bacterium]|nr:hypothetical protein [Ktedonobacteraceae bacterium]